MRAGPYEIESVHRAEEGGPWTSFYDAAFGLVEDPKTVADVQQLVEAAGGLSPDVCQVWFSTDDEIEEPGTVHMRNLGEKVLTGWMPVTPENFPCDGGAAG